MVTPDGFEVGFHGEYREIVPNERLVSTEVYEGIPDAEEHAALDILTLDRGGRANDPHRSSSSTRRRKAATRTSTPAWRTACRMRWISSSRSRLAALSSRAVTTPDSRSRGLFCSRPVSRILSRVTISLCGVPGLGGPRQRSLLRLAPDGVWRAGRVATTAGGLLPHRFTLTAEPPEYAAGRRSPFCSTFRRLSPPGLPRASCPAVSGLSSSLPPDGAPAVTRPARRMVTRISAIRSRPSARDRPALRGRRARRAACRTNSPHTRHSRLTPRSERGELLVERAVERDDDRSSRGSGTPQSPCRGSGRGRRRAARARRSRAGGGCDRRARGGTSSPSPRRPTRRRRRARRRSRRCARPVLAATTTMSPSRMPASIIDSPLTRRRKSASRPSGSGTAISSSIVLLGEQRAAGGDLAERAAASALDDGGLVGARLAPAADELDRARLRRVASEQAGALEVREVGVHGRRRGEPDGLADLATRSADSRARRRSRRGTARSPVVVSSASASGSMVGDERMFVKESRAPRRTASSQCGRRRDEGGLLELVRVSTVVSTSSSPVSGERVASTSPAGTGRARAGRGRRDSSLAGTARDDQRSRRRTSSAVGRVRPLEVARGCGRRRRRARRDRCAGLKISVVASGVRITTPPGAHVRRGRLDRLRGGRPPSSGTRSRRG